MPGDAVLLIVEDDPHYAQVLVDQAHARTSRFWWRARGSDALALAREHLPTAVSLDVFLPDMLGWTVLSQLKQDPALRHIPVQIITLDDDRQHGLARGAFSFLPKPTTAEGLDAGAVTHEGLYRRRAAEPAGRRGQRGRADEHRAAAGPRRCGDPGRWHRGGALAALRSQPYDCAVLDLRLPDMSGFDVLEHIKEDSRLADVPVVVFTGKELSPEEDTRLHTLARSVVVKGVESPERLLDETSLFLHRVLTESASGQAGDARPAPPLRRRPGRQEGPGGGR
jgi:CheY-like chemotaxis protein